MKKKIPAFRSDEEAALFWENHEILDYVAADEFKIVNPASNKKFQFKDPHPKPVKELISLRIDAELLCQAKRVAARKSVGYQSVLRQWLAKGSPAGVKS